MSKIQEVARFLKEWKHTCQHHNIDFVPRPKNLEGLAELEIPETLAKKMLKDLSVDDYVAGPKTDRNRPGEVWEFGLKINGNDVYIKIRLYQVNTETRPKCLSFHPAKYPLEYKFKGGDKI